MHISKNFFHDKSILALLSINLALAIVAVINVLLSVDTSLSSVSIISYRSSRAIQLSGPTSDLYQFAMVAGIVTVVSCLLSAKLYALRRHLAVSVLGLNVVTLVFGMIIFNALMRTA